MDFSCAILAGGNSRRMGRDKATFMIGEKALVNRVYDEAVKVFKEVIIISSHHESLSGIDAPIYKDMLPIQGPIVGIVSALMYASNPYVFVFACDMPFISEESIRYMISEAKGEDLIIPKTKGGYEPLYAIYGKSCMAHLFKLIEHGRLLIRDVFPFLSMKVLSGEGPDFMNNGYPVFTNINVMEDTAMLAERLKVNEKTNAVRQSEFHLRQKDA